MTTRIIDSHTGGEPTRLVVSGGPDLGPGPLPERLQRFRSQHDAWRRALVTEPRGNDVLVGALLCSPHEAGNACGVIFFNNAGYLGMCGHGTIGLVATLSHLGQIAVGRHGIETPVGAVQATLHSGGSVTVANVPAWRHAHHVAVDVPGVGRVHGDVAWGGNWFFLCHDHGLALLPANIAALTARAGLVRQALQAAGITGAKGAESDHIELLGPAQAPPAAISCFARGAPTTGRPAAPAPAPSWPVWPQTACWRRGSCGTRKASSAASSPVTTNRRRPARRASCRSSTAAPT